MADFYKVLRDALDRVGAQASTERSNVYAHVRGVMVRQLEARDPPLAAPEMAERLRAFDAARDLIEVEIATSLQPAPEPEAVRAEPALAEAEAIFTETSSPIPGRAPIPIPEPPATPQGTPIAARLDGVWDAPAIDLAWDEASEQWRDPEDGPPVTPAPKRERWPRRARQPVIEEPEEEPVLADDRDEPVVSYGAGLVADRGDWDERAAPPLRAERFETETSPVEDDLRRGGLFRRRRPEADDRPEPVVAPRQTAEIRNLPAVIGPARRRQPMPELGGATRYSDGEARPTIAPSATARLAPLDDDEVDNELDDRPRRSRAGRVFFLVIIALAVAVLAWCAYVFVPIFFPSGDDEAGAAAAPIAVFAGEDAALFEAGPDNPPVFTTDPAGNYVTVTSTAASGGARARIGPAIADGLAGHRVTVTVEVRATPDRAAETLRVGYQRGNTLLDWQVAPLGAGFATVEFSWDVPADSGNGNDYLLIAPGVPGDGTGVDVRSIVVNLGAAI